MQIIVVGGGSAGWIAAATLQSRLNGPGRGPVHITVLESPQTPRIGVGEATIPTFRGMLRRFGIGEPEFLRACDATFKQGIRFDDWAGPGSSYLHPFDREQAPQFRDAAALWLASDGARPFSDFVSVQGALIAANRAPRMPHAIEFQGAVPYAYHLDADRFADCLASHLLPKGIVRVAAHVTRVTRGDGGMVTGLTLDDGRILAADLYIDCTGQRGLLAPPDGGADAGPEAWISYASHLLCDRAVTLRIPENPATYSPPVFTRARALDAGWAWDIGLRHRRGRGYVYSSAHCTPDQAETALRAEEGPRATGIEARHIAFRSGRRASPWVGNVIAIGLSAGFLEPLESTGLYLADYAARALTELFPPTIDVARTPGKSAPLARRFNQLMAEIHDDLADFLTLHYAVSPRRDTPFWRDATDPARHSARLADLLAIWALRPPAFADFSLRYPPFSHQNYEYILLGSGWRPGALPKGRRPATPAPELLRKQRRLLAELPPHDPHAGPPMPSGGYIQ